MAKIIPGNPDQDDVGGIIQEQKKEVEKATASAAENLVFLMQMLQDFSRTIKTVTTAPGFTAEAYRRIVTTYQHHLNPQVEKYLNNLEKTGKLTKEQVFQERLLNQEFGNKIQKYVLMGGAISGLSFKLANLQEQMEKSAAGGQFANFVLPGGGGGPGRTPGLANYDRGGTKALGFDIERFRYELLGKYGEQIAKAGVSNLSNLQSQFRYSSLGLDNPETKDRNLELQKQISEILAQYGAVTQVDEARVINDMLNRYGGHDKNANIHTAGNYLRTVYSMFQGDIGGGGISNVANNIPELLSMVQAGAEKLENNRSGAFTMSGDAIQAVLQIFDTFSGTAEEGGMKSGALNGLVTVLSEAVNSNSQLSKLMTNAGGGRGLLANQSKFSKLAKENAPEAIMQVSKYVQSLEARVGPTEGMNLLKQNLISTLGGIDDFQMFYRLGKDMDKFKDRLSDLQLTFEDLSKAEGLWKFDPLKGTVTENLPRAVKNSADQGADLQEWFTSKFGKLQLAVAEIIPKEISYGFGTLGSAISLALPLLAIRSMTGTRQKGGSIGGGVRALLALDLLKSMETRERPAFDNQEGLATSPVDSAVDVGTQVGTFFVLSKFLKTHKAMPSAKELDKAIRVGNAGKLGAGAFSVLGKGGGLMGKLGKIAGGIGTIAAAADLMYAVLEGTAESGEIISKSIDVASLGAATFGGLPGVLAAATTQAVKYTESQIQENIKKAETLANIGEGPEVSPSKEAVGGWGYGTGWGGRAGYTGIAPRDLFTRPQSKVQKKRMPPKSMTEYNSLISKDFASELYGDAAWYRHAGYEYEGPLPAADTPPYPGYVAPTKGLQEAKDSLADIGRQNPGYVVVTFTDAEGNILGSTESVGPGDRSIVRLSAADIRVVG